MRVMIKLNVRSIKTSLWWIYVLYRMVFALVVRLNTIQVDHKVALVLLLLLFSLSRMTMIHSNSLLFSDYFSHRKDKLGLYLVLLSHLLFLIRQKISHLCVCDCIHHCLPDNNWLDVITAFAFTVSIECCNGFARKFVLIKAVIHPILLSPIQTHGYSTEFSKTRAITSPWLKPSDEKKLAKRFVRSSTWRETK